MSLTIGHTKHAFTSAFLTRCGLLQNKELPASGGSLACGGWGAAFLSHHGFKGFSLGWLHGRYTLFCGQLFMSENAGFLLSRLFLNFADDTGKHGTNEEN
jgi:hypothetical protein